ncbi:MAG: hypothetical protein ABIP20_17635 [Chthoniobacteraceae bacterium]
MHLSKTAASARTCNSFLPPKIFLACLAFASLAPTQAQNAAAPSEKPAAKPESPQPASATKADDTARWLAGLPPQDEALKVSTLLPAWKNHAAAVDAAWTNSERHRLTKVREWAPAALGETCTADSPVFYFFSGADFLYAHALFPKAKTYVLCAREPVGSQPDPARIKPGELAGALSTFRNSISSLLDFSFFITKELRKDVVQRHIPGILPVLEFILAREGARISEVETVRCDDTGAISSDEQTQVGSPGVRIRFRTGEEPEQTLYYFYGDLSNGGLKIHGGVLKFCETLGTGRSLLKAASYLPHVGAFSVINEWVLEHSNAVVQDTSGIPFRKFSKDKWTLRFWGHNAQPIGLFKQHAEPDLKAAVSAAPAQPIPFGFGYQHEPANSLLILAERTAAK